MIFPAPTATEERQHVLHERVRRLKKKSAIGEEAFAGLASLWPSSWKSHGAVLAAVFFVMTCIAITAFNGIVEIFSLPRGPVVLAACVVLAEVLIRKRRMFGTGIETALIAGGLVSFIAWLPSEGKPEALLVFSLAAAITAWRMHSAPFGCAAVLLAYVYVAVKSEKDVVLMLAVGFALVAIAGLALLRQIERPWLEWMLAFSMIALVPVMYVAARIAFWSNAQPLWIAVAFLVASLALIGAGLGKRHHAHLVAGMLSLVAVTIESWDLVTAGAEAKLIGLGIVLFALSLGFSRALRDRTAGMVAAPLELTPFDDALQVAAAGLAAASPGQPHPSMPAAEPIGGGGASGGAGATGQW